MLNEWQLNRIQERAARAAYVWRHEKNNERADYEEIARAWERLADAAHHLALLPAAQRGYTPGPPPDKAPEGPPKDDTL